AIIAALVMASAKHVLEATHDLAAAVGELNGYLVGRLPDNFVSFLAVRIDGSSNEIMIVNAAMCAPALYRRKAGRATILEMKKVGYPLGILPKATYEAETIVLQEGDALVLYSDGLTDSMSRSGETFGSQGIISALDAAGGES